MASCVGWPTVTVRLTPGAGTALAKGQQLVFGTEVDYSACRPGYFFVYFTDQSARTLGVPWTPADFTNAQIPVGSGTARLMAPLTVPDQGVSSIVLRLRFQYTDDSRAGIWSVSDTTYAVQ
jgi:hypothetical protein